MGLRGRTEGLAAVAHGSAQHAAQHVVAAVAARLGAVSNGERQRSDVILQGRQLVLRDCYRSTASAGRYLHLIIGCHASYTAL